MNLLDSDELSEKTVEFLNNNDNPALFAGSGVAAHAGIITWNDYMYHLAKVADEYDPLSGELIRRRTQNGHYLSAAAVYKTCPQIPRGELFKQLSSPFIDPPSAKKLNALISLPFSAVFTTNYDRSIHDAYASVVGRSPKTVELCDPSMVHAPYFVDFYIARLHGRAELPETIILSDEDYKKIENDNVYIDFLRHILTRYSCLFIGYSFIDPAIDHILQIIEKRLSPGFPRLHLAFLPSDADSKLIARLSEFNIRILQYESKDEHLSLWEGIKKSSRYYTKDQKIDKPPASIPLQEVKRFIATSYARVKLDKELHPLRELVIDGIVLDILSKSDEKEITTEKILAEIGRILSISIDQNQEIIEQRIESLKNRRWCDVQDNKVISKIPFTDILAKDLNILVDGVIYRIKVREGIRTKPQIRNILSKIIEEVLITRGWDLGAHYAGAKMNELPNIFQTISLIVEKYASKLSPDHREGITLSCFDLFQSPDESESTILAELGRVAFALQLIFNSPCAVIAHSMVIPEHIYLDASFLMPAIVEGHPFRSLYINTMNRVNKAASSSGIRFKFFIADDFLNEIISHKELAISEIENIPLESAEDFSAYLSYHSPENVNIFIAAYGKLIQQEEYEESFVEFLNHYAPYHTEKELSNFISKLGLGTIKLSFDSTEYEKYCDIRKKLKEAYEADIKPWYKQKEEVLINHEARQLTQLLIEAERGINSIFVTSDNRLRRLSLDSVPGKPGSYLISHLGLVQLIDILLGVSGDPIITVRLLWGSVVSDESIQIRNYLINSALKYRDEAMTMSLSEVLQKIVPEYVDDAQKRKIDILPGGSTESRIRTSRWIDFLEDRFYSDMADVINRRFPEEYNLAEELRKKHLMDLVHKTEESIIFYDNKLRISTNFQEKNYLSKEIAELNEYLMEYRNELREIME